MINSRRIEAYKWQHYQEAKDAKSYWTAMEKSVKADLLHELGYEDDDEKPAPVDVFASEDGQELGSVHVGSRKGLDINYLREKYPDIYAECEKWTHPISIRAPR